MLFFSVFITVDELKKYTTLVFLTFFILVKVNPVYYSLQLLPLQPGHDSSRTAKFLAYGNNLMMAKMDKAINDKVNCPTIPAVIFFCLIFACLFRSDNSKLRFSLRRNRIGYGCPVYLRQCVFRL